MHLLHIKETYRIQYGWLDLPVGLQALFHFLCSAQELTFAHPFHQTVLEYMCMTTRCRNTFHEMANANVIIL